MLKRIIAIILSTFIYILRVITYPFYKAHEWTDNFANPIDYLKKEEIERGGK